MRFGKRPLKGVLLAVPDSCWGRSPSGGLACSLLGQVSRWLSCLSQWLKQSARLKKYFNRAAVSSIFLQLRTDHVYLRVRVPRCRRSFAACDDPGRIRRGLRSVLQQSLVLHGLQRSGVTSVHGISPVCRPCPSYLVEQGLVLVIRMLRVRRDGIHQPVRDVPELHLQG